MAVSNNCFVCNTLTPVLGKNKALDILSPHNAFKSGRSVKDVLSEILSRPLEEPSSAMIICRNCFKACMEYDDYEQKKLKIQKQLDTSYKMTQVMNSLKSELVATSKPPTIVVPASKMKPLTNYVVVNAKDNGNAPRVPTLIINGSEISTQNHSPIKTTKETTSLLRSSNSVVQRSRNSVGSLSMPILTDTMNIKDELNSLSNIEEMEQDSQNKSLEEVSTAISEITELSETSDAVNIEKVNEEEPKRPQNVFNINILSNLGGETSLQDEDYIVNKVEILDEDDLSNSNDGNQTFLMESNGSLIRLMAGQKLMYGDKEISLIIPQDDDEENDDSNEDTQILEMSGDEDDANMLIEAANEEGGTIITMDSEDLLRLKSVTNDTLDLDSEMSLVDNSTVDIGNNDASLITIPVSETIVKKEEDNKYTCLLCLKSEASTNYVGTSDTITTHLKTEHNTRIIICPVCGDVFGKKSEMNQHFVLHEKEVLTTASAKKTYYECTICKKKWGNRPQLLQHIKSNHNGERPYRCERCAKTFASKYTHQAHMKTHETRVRPYDCTECNKSFFTPANLQQHVKRHNGVKDFHCKDCGKSFSSQHNLEVHGVVHSKVKPFVCAFCNKAFARKAEIRDHIRTHTGERPFACNICGARFSQRSNLHSHTRATHTKERPHPCGMCDKRFKRKRLLGYHIKACHTGERPYKCDICSATFIYPEHYKKHIRIHSGEKPYVCEVCGKGFSSRDNRNTHRFVHSDKKPYECLVCGAGFMRKPLLYSHMMSSGHMTESIVVNQPCVREENENEAATGVTETEEEGNTETLIDAEKLDPSILAQLANGATDNNADGDGGVVRLVQIELPNGSNGWVQLN